MMLHLLRAEQFAIFDEIEVDFSDGMNTLTGESGAGKSLALEAVRLAMGGRPEGAVVRAGAAHAWIEAVFQVDPALFPEADPEGQLVFARQIFQTGKSVFRLNGHAVSAQILRELADRLVEQVGQGEGADVMRPHVQRRLLDAFAGNEELLSKRAVLERELKQVAGAMARLGGDERARRRQSELLKYQVQEIDEASLEPGEEEELRGRRRILAEREGLLIALKAGREGILGGGRPGAYDQLARAAGEVGRFRDLTEELTLWQQEADGALSLLQDLGQRLAAMAQSVDMTPGELERAEERLLLIEDLKRKYGDDLEAVLRFGLEAQGEIERLEGAEEELARLSKRAEEIRQELDVILTALFQMRSQRAPELARAIEGELSHLGFEHPRFEVRVDGDEVVFWFRPNPGEPARPLSEIASGGEQSRTLLALKAFQPEEAGAVLILDEVDQGLGGETARAVTERLKALSKKVQVIAVTHQAVLAARADRHITFYKEVSGDRTRVESRVMTGEDRVREVARMLAGSGDRVGLEHARELLDSAQT